MAKCYLEIRFDRPDRTYKPGEKITGTLVVLVGPDCQCRKITLTPTWTTHGGGREDSATAEGQVLPGAVWHDVEEASYPFELPAPSGPVSYRGDLFEVAWSLKAVADLPLAFDAVAEEQFTLAHGDPSAAVAAWDWQGGYSPFISAASSASKPLPHPAFYSAVGLIPLVLGPPILFAIGWYAFAGREKSTSGDWEGPVIFTLITLAVLTAVGSGFRRAMRRKRRAAQNQLSTRPLESGEKLPRPLGKYWQKPSADDSPRGWARIVMSLTFGAIGLFLLLTSAAAIAGRGMAALSLLQILLLLLGVLLILATMRGIVTSLRTLKVRWKIGHVDVNLTPNELRCGGDLCCSVEFRPPTPVQLDQATARLEAFEVAGYASNEHPVTNTRLVREYEVTLAAGRPLQAQESASLSGKIPVPADAPPTFLAVDHKILWFVGVRLQLTGGTSWSRDIPILVLP